MRYSNKRDSAQVRKGALVEVATSVTDSDLKIAAVNTKPMAIEEIGSDEERQNTPEEEEGNAGNG